MKAGNKFENNNLQWNLNENLKFYLKKTVIDYKILKQKYNKLKGILTKLLLKLL